MSRIGRLPITVPAGVHVQVKDLQVHVKGPKGELKMEFLPAVEVKLDGNTVHVTRTSEQPSVRALHGTTRALISNMVTGVSTGFTRTLSIDGVGYRPELNGKDLVLYVGYSHPVTFEPPTGISFEVDTRARLVKILGFDKEQVGQVASDIREIRPPEPYKGKGIRYQDEKIRRKAGKAGKGKGKK